LRRTISSITGREEHAVDVDDQDGHRGDPAGAVEPAAPEAVASADPPVGGIDPLPKDLRLTDVTAQAFEAMQGLVHRYRQAAFPADVTVDVPVDACRTLDFHRATEMVELGQRLTAEALDRAGIS
jgi:NTE family protein